MIEGDWIREAEWIDGHFNDICQIPEAENQRLSLFSLENVANLALVLSTLFEAVPDNNTVVTGWVRLTMGRLGDYLTRIEGQFQIMLAAGSNRDDIYSIPYLLVERRLGLRFKLTDSIRSSVAKKQPSGSHDELLLAGLAGRPGSLETLTSRLLGSRAEAAAGGIKSSRGYDLTHEILYLYQLEGQSRVIDDSLAAIKTALVDFMPWHRDLGAELLACYWLANGRLDSAALESVKLLQNYSESSERLVPPCTVCSQFKAQIHERLTMVLALGTTLGVQGEVFSDFASASNGSRSVV